MSRYLVNKFLDAGLDARDNNFENYLKDESRFEGWADVLITAYTEVDVQNAISLCDETETPITVVSGKTSLTGAPVPSGGVILDVKNLNNINPSLPNKVGPGAILKNYKDFVDSVGLFFPPDPTSEDSCTIGGNVACNASGALSYLYGPTRNYIEGLRVILPTAVTINLQRGVVFSDNGVFRIPKGIAYPYPENEMLIPAPSWKTESWTILKNTAGFYASDRMDLVDLFIGSEGILGVIVEITTKLLKRRRSYFSLIIYLPDRETTVYFVKALNMLKKLNTSSRNLNPDNIPQKMSFNAQLLSSLNCSKFPLIIPSCMEWFGNSTASLLPHNYSKLLRDSYGAIFIEQEYDDQEQMLQTVTQWSELIEQFNLICGEKSGGIKTQVALDIQQSRAFKNLRQSVPEKLNDRIHQGFTKIGSDFSVPPGRLEDLLKMYDDQLPRGSSYVFGHIGNSHIHANIVPGTKAELWAAQQIMFEMSQQIVALGGSIAGEHGIGKIKSKYLEMAVGKETVRKMKQIKRCLDPKNILNRNTLLSVTD